MKRKANISWFLMLVSFIMLTASVLPHHHHRDLFCLQPTLSNHTSVCNEIDVCCSHEHEINHESCEDENSASECGFVCITNFHCSEPDSNYDMMDPHYALEAVLFTLTDFFKLSFYSQDEFTNEYAPYHELLHSEYFLTSIGLRGPPSFHC